LDGEDIGIGGSTAAHTLNDAARGDILLGLRAAHGRNPEVLDCGRDGGVFDGLGFGGNRIEKGGILTGRHAILADPVGITDLPHLIHGIRLIVGISDRNGFDCDKRRIGGRHEGVDGCEKTRENQESGDRLSAHGL
jgi:hypothetical protein